jgi:hypothetical protein
LPQSHIRETKNVTEQTGNIPLRQETIMSNTRFQPGQSGNPAGRPRGAKNKTTLFMEALSDQHGEEIVTRLTDWARDGDMTALRLWLDRMVPRPKGRPVSFDLPPIDTLEAAPRASAAVLAAIAAGELTPTEGSEVMKTIERHFHLLAKVEQVSAQLAEPAHSRASGNPEPLDKDRVPAFAATSGRFIDENTSSITPVVAGDAPRAQPALAAAAPEATAARDEQPTEGAPACISPVFADEAATPQLEPTLAAVTAEPPPREPSERAVASPFIEPVFSETPDNAGIPLGLGLGAWPPIDPDAPIPAELRELLLASVTASTKEMRNGAHR